MNQSALMPGAIKREPLPLQIAAKLRQDIFTGVYAVGDRLPTERELAESMSISRVSVRQALQELAKEKWIEIVQGRGVTVLDYDRRIGLDALPSLLTSCSREVVTPETFRAMYDFSNWLTKQICISAAMHAGPEDEKTLMDIIGRYQDGISARDYAAIEADFYYELLRIGNNLVFKMFFNTYMDTFQMLVDSGTLMLPPLPRPLFVNINTELVGAVCARRGGDIDGIVEKYKPEIQAVLGSYLKMINVNIA